MRTMLLVTTLFAAASLSFSLPAFANDDEDGPGMMGGQSCEMMGHGGMDRGGMRDSEDTGMMGGHRMMHEHRRAESAVKAKLASLKSQLEITDAQADVWKGYADAVAGQAKAMKTARRAMEDAMDKDSPVDRLDSHIAGMEAVLDSMKTMKAAVEKLYGALSDEQKKVADDVIGSGCGAM